MQSFCNVFTILFSLILCLYCINTVYLYQHNNTKLLIMIQTIELLQNQSTSEMIVAAILSPSILITGKLELMGEDIGTGKNIEFEFTVACQFVKAAVDVYPTADGYDFHDLQMWVDDEDGEEIIFRLDQQDDIIKMITK